MSLPIIIIFERHWDTIPKLVVKDLLPRLAEQGYDTVCFEFPQDMSAKEIIQQHREQIEIDSNIFQEAESLLKMRNINTLTNLSSISYQPLTHLMRCFVSSKQYLDVAEKIKQLPASIILKDIFANLKQISISLKGIDINRNDYNEMISIDLSKRMGVLNTNEILRINTIFNNLIRLKIEKDGVVFVCGALHAKNLIDKFKKNNMDSDVLYFFPHSSQRYDDSLDDIKDISMNETLQNHTFILNNEIETINAFNLKIIKDVSSKIKYKSEICEGNSHTRLLSNFFKRNFRAFLRPGYLVDALLNIDENPNHKDIKLILNKNKILTRVHKINQQHFLVVPAVNTRNVADKILCLDLSPLS